MNSLDLYTTLGLDRSATSETLGKVLIDRDFFLESQLIPATDPRREQIQTAFAILGNEHHRSVYDRALEVGHSMGWTDLRHLGDFGSFPIVGPAPIAQGNPYNYPVGTPPQAPPAAAQPTVQPPVQPPAQPQPSPWPNAPYTPPAAMAPVSGYQAYPGVMPTDRPSRRMRLGMMLLDGLVVSAISTPLSMLLFGADDSVSTMLLYGLVGLAYFLGTEVLTGASPVKHLFGYEVRDANTGAKLTWEQSAKRQWWRIVAAIPGFGSTIAFFAMIAIGVSINPANNYSGFHDRWAGAVVARKNR